MFYILEQLLLAVTNLKMGWHKNTLVQNRTKIFFIYEVPDERY